MGNGFLKKHWGKCLVALGLLAIIYCRGYIDDGVQAIGLTSSRMAKVTHMARLAPFPSQRTAFQLKWYQSIFGESWSGSFRAQPEVITSWLKNSPGVQEGDKGTQPWGATRYILETTGVPGWLEVSPDGEEIKIYLQAGGLDPLPRPHHDLINR